MLTGKLEICCHYVFLAIFIQHKCFIEVSHFNSVHFLVCVRTFLSILLSPGRFLVPTHFVSQFWGSLWDTATCFTDSCPEVCPEVGLVIGSRTAATSSLSSSWGWSTAAGPGRTVRPEWPQAPGSPATRSGRTCPPRLQSVQKCFLCHIYANLLYGCVHWTFMITLSRSLYET